jgi:hypothetical protein
MRLGVLGLLLLMLGCHSAQMRGPGPGNAPAVGKPGTKTAEMPASRNDPTRYGWGSDYDPHRPGSLATPGTPYETGAVPPFPLGYPLYGAPPVGMPPPDTEKDTDEK